jgi:hypothetical protein
MSSRTAFFWKLETGDCSRISYTRLPATPSVVSSILSHSFSTVALTSACVEASGLREAKDCACICNMRSTGVTTSTGHLTPSFNDDSACLQVTITYKL